MQRYFVNDHSINLDQLEIRITGDDVGHIVKVMRSAPGDTLICCNALNGSCYLAEIHQMEKEQVICKIVEEMKEDRELPVWVCIAQGLPKGDKMEWVIQKGTELGAHQFVPFTSSRTVVQLDQKKEQKRLQRWEKIAKEAAEQSHRRLLPSIEPIHSWKQLLQLSGDFDLALLAYENEQTSSLYEKLSGLEKKGKILIAIGPEGGFSEKEVKEAMEHGFQSIMLGKRILRTETAALYGLSSLSFYYEQMSTT